MTTKAKLAAYALGDTVYNMVGDKVADTGKITGISLEIVEVEWESREPGRQVISRLDFGNGLMSGALAIKKKNVKTRNLWVLLFQSTLVLCVPTQESRRT